ncbi:MAG TPA: autotransporter domain-containing protein [Verrucomicrobium sp.]|nr:autotransporter domain-containing protein [Verrucomicrobium sp.]
MKRSRLLPGLALTTLALVTLPLTPSPSLAADFTVNAGVTDNTAKTLTTGNTGTVQATGTLSISGSTTAVAITGTGTVNVINSGSILQTGTGRGIDNTGGGNSGTRIITNNAGGLIQTADGDTIRINRTDSNVTINNYGIIRSNNASKAGNQVLDFNAITSGTNIVNNYLGGLIEATAADAIRPGTNGVVNNWGTISAIPVVEMDGILRVVSGSDGIDAQTRTGIQVFNSGTVSGRHGITGEDSGSGFVITVTNYQGGTIQGVNGSGINIDESTAVANITNYGSIIGNFDSTKYDVGDGDGVDVDGIVTLDNYGVIKGINAGGLNDGSLNNSEGVSIGGGTIINRAGAVISGENNAATASVGNGILVDDSNGSNAFAATTITNSGLIQGKSGFGIKIIGTFADTITNSAGGVIQGAGNVTTVQTGGGADILTNRGAIISGSGQAVDLGDGDDSLFILGGQAAVVGDVHGGAGVNTLVINPGSGGVFKYEGSFFDFQTAEFQSGTTVLNGTSHITGLTSVSGGSLLVNGALVTPLVNVSHGALLGGNGYISGSVHNAGTVSPGNSIGRLTIGGNYTQTSSGTLLIEVAGPGRYDRLVVHGTAHLDGTLRIAALNKNVSFGDQYPFLRAGKITGRFDRIVMPNPGILRGRFLTEGGTGILLVAPASYTLVAQTPNQTRLARALDRWIGIEDGDIGEVTLALDVLRADQYPAAFEAILPTYYEGAIRTGIELSHNHGQLLHQQLSARRLCQRAMISEGSAAPASSTLDSKNPKAVQKVAAPVQPPIGDDARWSAWVQGSGLFSSGGLSLTPGEDFESGTILVGADYALSEHFALGLFASYQEGWGDYAHGGETDLESVRFGLYATVDLEGFYANAAVGGGTTDYSISRPLSWATLDRTARSNPDAAEFFSIIGTGYDFQFGNLTLGPQLSAQYTRLEMDGVKETGAGVLNLGIDDTTSESFRTYLGGRLAYTIHVSERVAIIPELRVFWQHEFLQDEETLRASLNGGSGPGFDFHTSSPDRDAVFVGAGVGVQVGTQVYFNVYYNADFGRGDDGNHAVSASATFKF